MKWLGKLTYRRGTDLKVFAKKGGRIVGMAGASADCAKMWQSCELS